MTYRPCLHHFTLLLMSVAVGLAFTGCGNSSNGGSTGSTFEQVPLIGEDYARVVFKGGDSGNTLGIEIVLQHDGTLWITIATEEQSESFSGSGRATQRSNNSYQIELSGTELTSNTCEMTCNALILTIPEGQQLKAYRNGQKVSGGATLEVNFTHKPKEGKSCTLPASVNCTLSGDIQQKPELPPR